MFEHSDHLIDLSIDELNTFELEILPSKQELSVYRSFLKDTFNRNINIDFIRYDNWNFSGQKESTNIFNSNTEIKTLEKVVGFEASQILKLAERFKLNILRPRILLTGNSLYSQYLIIKALNKIAKKNKYLFALEFDNTLGYPEIISQKLQNMCVDSPDELLDMLNAYLTGGLSELSKFIKMLNKDNIRIDMITMCKDICFDKGTYLPEWIMDKFYFPFLKEQISQLRKMGIKFILKHTDGNILSKDSNKISVLKKLINSGIDIIHPIEPLSVKITDVINEIRENNKKNIFIAGGIDLTGSHIINKKDIQKHIIKTIDSVKKYKYFIPGSSTILGSKNIERKNYDMFINILFEKLKISPFYAKDTTGSRFRSK